MNRRCAPVFITVYDRLDHLKKCIDYLKQCEGARETTVFISSDAAYKEEHTVQIERVREYILSIDGFGKIVPLFHESNIGSQSALRHGKVEIFSKHDRMIRLEDDVIVASNFLTYMNDALEFYSDNENVVSVSAFSYSLFFPYDQSLINKTYFTHRFNPWGFGIWKHKLLLGNEYEPSDILKALENVQIRRKLDSVGLDLVPSFTYLSKKGRTLPNDFLHVYHMVVNNKVAVAPYYSKSFNIGNDGTGLRTSKNKKFIEIDIDFLNNVQSYEFSTDIFNNINNSFGSRIYDKPFYKVKRLAAKMGLLEFGMKFKNILR